MVAPAGTVWLAQQPLLAGNRPQLSGGRTWSATPMGTRVVTTHPTTSADLAVVSRSSVRPRRPSTIRVARNSNTRFVRRAADRDSPMAASVAAAGRGASGLVTTPATTRTASVGRGSRSISRRQTASAVSLYSTAIEQLAPSSPRGGARQHCVAARRRTDAIERWHHHPHPRSHRSTPGQELDKVLCPRRPSTWDCRFRVPRPQSSPQPTVTRSPGTQDCAGDGDHPHSGRAVDAPLTRGGHVAGYRRDVHLDAGRVVVEALLGDDPEGLTVTCSWYRPGGMSVMSMNWQENPLS